MDDPLGAKGNSGEHTCLGPPKLANTTHTTVCAISQESGPIGPKPTNQNFYKPHAIELERSKVKPEGVAHPHPWSYRSPRNPILAQSEVENKGSVGRRGITCWLLEFFPSLSSKIQSWIGEILVVEVKQIIVLEIVCVANGNQAEEDVAVAAEQHHREQWSFCLRTFRSLKTLGDS